MLVLFHKALLAASDDEINFLDMKVVSEAKIQLRGCRNTGNDNYSTYEMWSYYGRAPVGNSCYLLISRTLWVRISAINLFYRIILP